MRKAVPEVQPFLFCDLVQSGFLMHPMRYQKQSLFYQNQKTKL
jgi:hypothetical protein